MIRSYKLDGHTPVQTSSIEAALWRGNNYSACVVGLDEWGEGSAHVTVSTVFLAFDHRRIGEAGDPILFETMVFGGPHSDKQVRYTTWEGAAMGHAEMVKRCRFDGDPHTKIAALRERAEKAEARVKVLEAEAEALEQRTYGWIVGDPEGVYADFDECMSNFDYDPDDGAIIEWEVATVLRTERYRIVHERDEEGDIIDTRAELVTAATGPLDPEKDTPHA